MTEDDGGEKSEGNEGYSKGEEKEEARTEEEGEKSESTADQHLMDPGLWPEKPYRSLETQNCLQTGL